MTIGDWTFLILYYKCLKLFPDHVVNYIYVTTDGLKRPVSQLASQSADCTWFFHTIVDDYLASCLTGLFEPSVVTYIWYTFTQCTRLILLDLQTLADKPSDTYLWALFWNVVEYVYNGNWLLLVTRSITRRVLLYARGAVGYWTKYREIKNNPVKKQLYCSMRCLYSDFQIHLS
jgi:hypothetical protein